MNKKQGLAGVLLISVLVSGVPVFANEQYADVLPSISVMPIHDQEIHYDLVRGTVLEITETDNGKLLSLGSDGEVNTHLLVSNTTYVIDGDKLKVGDSVTGYFKSNMMHIMIYPARYTAEVLVVENSERNVHVGRFNTELLSDDGNLILKNTNEIEIFTKDGALYTGDIANKTLAVLYTVSTRSLPAQTTPSKIIVLDDYSNIKPEIQALYNETKGKILSIDHLDGRTILNIEDVSGNPVIFVLSDSTYILDSEPLNIGDSVVGYYKSNKPMILIYPPQYSLDVLVKESGIDSIYVGSFDKENLSDNGNLSLGNIDNIPVVSITGKKHLGSITNKPVLVLYNVATKSIPAQIKPLKIVVLEQEVENMDIVVNGSILTGVRAYSKDGVVMLPLRAISEILGYDIGWDNSTRTAFVGKTMSLSIGKDTYNFAKMTPIQLGAAPEIVNGSTYVPLEFFTEIMKVNEVIVGTEISIR